MISSIERSGIETIIPATQSRTAQERVLFFKTISDLRRIGNVLQESSLTQIEQASINSIGYESKQVGLPLVVSPSQLENNADRYIFFDNAKPPHVILLISPHLSEPAGIVEQMMSIREISVEIEPFNAVMSGYSENWDLSDKRTVFNGKHQVIVIKTTIGPGAVYCFDPIKTLQNSGIPARNIFPIFSFSNPTRTEFQNSSNNEQFNFTTWYSSFQYLFHLFFNYRFSSQRPIPIKPAVLVDSFFGSYNSLEIVLTLLSNSFPSLGLQNLIDKQTNSTIEPTEAKNIRSPFSNLEMDLLVKVYMDFLNQIAPLTLGLKKHIA